MLLNHIAVGVIGLALSSLCLGQQTGTNKEQAGRQYDYSKLPKQKQLPTVKSSKAGIVVSQPVITAPGGYQLQIESLSVTKFGTEPVEVPATVPPDRKEQDFQLLGGGCIVSYPPQSGHAQTMVSSMPAGDSWICKSDNSGNIQNQYGWTTSTVIYAKALKTGTPSIGLDCGIREDTQNRPPERYPLSSVALTDLAKKQGYFVTGGGCSSQGVGVPEPIVVSKPTKDATGRMTGWFCQAADPAGIKNDAQVKAYVVACVIRDKNVNDSTNLGVFKTSLIESGTTPKQRNPPAAAPAPPNSAETGGGCEVSYYPTSHAELVVRNTRLDDGWSCMGYDPPGVENEATAKAYGIFIHR